MTKHIFVTGGVVRSLGKADECLNRNILESRGLRVKMQKLDPYINVDPGTMSPYQHGEVYVLDDGSETDLDLGHYERSPYLYDRATIPPVRFQSVINKEHGVSSSGKQFKSSHILPMK